MCVFLSDRCKPYTDPLPVGDVTESHNHYPHNLIKDVRNKVELLKSKNKVWITVCAIVLFIILKQFAFKYVFIFVPLIRFNA